MKKYRIPPIFLAILIATIVFAYEYRATPKGLPPSDSQLSRYAAFEQEQKDDLRKSEAESIRVYRIGYNDGRGAYGLPASSRASASHVYLSNGYNFRPSDYLVYEMGYEDGMYGRSKQYYG